jgi:membrane protease YdiL (CAAX protease family)
MTLDEPTGDDSPEQPAASQDRPDGRWWRWFPEHLRYLRADAITWYAVLVSAATLTISMYHCTNGEYQQLFGRYDRQGGAFAAAAAWLNFPRAAQWLTLATGHTADFIYWFLSSNMLFVALPLFIAAFIPRVRLAELGWGLGDWRYGLKAFTVLFLGMLPFVIGASRSPSFAREYPMAGGANSSWTAFFTYEICYALYFIGWEFIYRGVLANGLYPRFGAAAILLPAIPFAIMHAGKPEAEAYGAIVAAIVLGVVAVRARSFWYGAALHAAIAITMDVIALTHGHRWPNSPSVRAQPPVPASAGPDVHFRPGTATNRLGAGTPPRTEARGRDGSVNSSTSSNASVTNVIAAPSRSNGVR